MKQRKSSLSAGTAVFAGFLAAGACDGDSGSELSRNAQNLSPECLAQGEQAPAGAWLCPAPFTAECSAELPPVYVQDALNPSCTEPLVVSDIAISAGTHAVEVRRANGGLACQTSLTLVDTAPPALVPQTLNLWPPNHKFHTIEVSDCVEVRDACDADLKAEFVWASSDEPVDDRGDGHHQPDILIDDCGRVQVRAERQGPKDGRVYKLGVRVVDRSGNAAESACTIAIDHDQRGVLGQDSGESYRIELDGQDGLPACDGSNEPVPDAGTPPSADAGTPSESDAGSPSEDAGTPAADAGTPAPDGAVVI